jgi:DNA-binding LacI/PurR family transcriptional regulator
VTIDNEAIGRMAADYFIKRNFKHICYITGDHTMPFACKRLEGFRRAMLKAHLKPLIYDDQCLSGLNPVNTTDRAILYIPVQIATAFQNRIGPNHPR